MEYLVQKIIIDVNEMISHNDNRKYKFIHDWIVDLLIFTSENNIEVLLISTNLNARNLLMNNIAEDIEAKTSIKIFDKNNLKNDWDVWRVENKINKSNSIIAVSSLEFINFFKDEKLFTFFLSVFGDEEESEKYFSKTVYKKQVNSNELIDELPNILFKLDSFLE